VVERLWLIFYVRCPFRDLEPATLLYEVMICSRCRRLIPDFLFRLTDLATLGLSTDAMQTVSRPELPSTTDFNVVCSQECRIAQGTLWTAYQHDQDPNTDLSADEDI